MIVTASNVHDALTYFALGGAAEAEAAFLAAERARELKFAELYLKTEGSVKERECLVIVNDDYQVLLINEHDAKVALTKAKSRAAGADKMIEIYRTENANIRAAEKLR